MKNLVYLLVAAVLLTAGVPVTSAQAATPSVVVYIKNAKIVYPANAKPYVAGSALMVPGKFTLQKLGAQVSVSQSAAKKSVLKATRSGKTAEWTQDRRNYTVNGNALRMDASSIVNKGTLYISLQSISSGLDVRMNTTAPKPGANYYTTRMQFPLSVSNLPEVIAIYSGGKINRAEFTTYLNLMRFLNPEYESQESEADYFATMAEGFIAGKTATKKLGNTNLSGLLKDVDSQVAELRYSINNYFGSGTAYTDRLKEFKLKEQDLVLYLQERYRVQTYINSLVSTTTVKTEYNRLIKTGQLKKTIATVSHILIAGGDSAEPARTKPQALTRAKQVLSQLKDGADFAEMAKQYSDDPGSKDVGGTYADADVSNWVPEFRDASISLPLNQLSEPVETVYGYHIMKVTKRQSSVQPYEEASEEIRYDLLNQKYNSFVQAEVKAKMTSNFVKP